MATDWGNTAGRGEVSPAGADIVAIGSYTCTRAQHSHPTGQLAGACVGVASGALDRHDILQSLPLAGDLLAPGSLGEGTGSFSLRSATAMECVRHSGVWLYELVSDRTSDDPIRTPPKRNSSEREFA